MRKIGFILLLLTLSSIHLIAGNLTTSQLVKLVQCKTISEISSIATSNGYKLSYKRDGAKGYEGYNVTDIAWAYNAKYVPATNQWTFTGNYTAIKLLYNNSTKSPETIVYVVSDGTTFNTIRNQISNFGYQFYQEDINLFRDAVAYCYYNPNVGIFATFAEYYNGTYQIHFYRD